MMLEGGFSSPNTQVFPKSASTDFIILEVLSMLKEGNASYESLAGATSFVNNGGETCIFEYC